jgi:hypothetical protein
LRERAKAKFTRAMDMLFDRIGLEMATHEAVARWRAGLIPEGASVWDATVGIGSDLIGLALQRPASGIEIDPDRARLARHNLRVHGADASIQVGDCLESRIEADFWFADPVRREPSRRSVRLADARPSPLALAGRGAATAGGAVKLSPMTPDDDLALLGGRRLFVSYQRECREALVLLGGIAPGLPERAAVLVETGQTIEGGTLPRPVLSSPLAWIFEADPAAVRAGALGCFRLAALGDAPGYLTGEGPFQSPWLRGYKTLWAGPFQPDKVKRALSDLGSGLTAVKSRGARIDPPRVMAGLKNAWPRRTVLFVYRTGRSLKAALTLPMSPT